jgi:hypothetical protein
MRDQLQALVAFPSAKKAQLAFTNRLLKGIFLAPAGD